MLTLVGSDVQSPIEERNKSILLGSSDWVKKISYSISKDPSKKTNSSESLTLPLASHVENLPLLQEQFANSMKLLQEFSAANCRTAKRALVLINSVLDLHSNLSITLAWNKNRFNLANKGASNGHDSSKSAFAADWSLARSGTRLNQQHSLHSAGTNEVESFVTTVQSPQMAIDALLWQAPEIDFLSLEEIDRIMASFTTIA